MQTVAIQFRRIRFTTEIMTITVGIGDDEDVREVAARMLRGDSTIIEHENFGAEFNIKDHDWHDGPDDEKTGEPEFNSVSPFDTDPLYTTQKARDSSA